jgi:hypothetical protein
MKRIVFLPGWEREIWVPPSGRILAYFHGGRIFTDTLPLLARTGLASLGLLYALWWVGYWGVVYRDYERWSLVGATVVQVVFLGLVYLFGRIAWLRIDHLHQLPTGGDVALRSLPILLRLAAELGFVFAVGLTLRVFAMPGVPPPRAVIAADGTWATFGQFLPNPLAMMAIGTWLALAVAAYAILAILFFYGLANAIEVYLQIEKNTRNSGITRKEQGHVPAIHAVEM